jgi:Ca2+-transporting ATPase
MQEVYTKAYSKSADEVLLDLSSSVKGLTQEKIVLMRQRFGENSLPEVKGVSTITIFSRQFKSPLIYILILSAIVVFLLGDVVDAAVIAAVLLINAIVGTIQEGKAENTLAAFRKFATTNCVVIRNGIEEMIADTEVVVGDILALREGDKIGADARVIQVSDIKIDESSLTGETELVHKQVESLTDTPELASELFKQKNMIFKGTTVQGGSALAVVTSVGTSTSIGSISKELSIINTEMPLKQSISHISNMIIVAVISVVLLVFFLGLSRGFELKYMISTAAAIAVSAIPEGLPVTITLILAAGVYRMGKKNALVKKLQAVEALGQADVVATDKTGTLTLNQMMVQEIFVDGVMYKVDGSGYIPEGKITRMSDMEVVNPKLHDGITALARTCALMSDSSIVFDLNANEWRKVSGDSTETALTVFAQKVGFVKDEMKKEWPFVSEILFSSDIKYHSVVYTIEGENVYLITGAPEVVLEKCQSYFKNGKNHDLTIENKLDIEKAIQSMASKGLRVLAIAQKKKPAEIFSVAGNIPQLTFTGLVGISDVLRENIFLSVQKAKQMGVKVVMITGDYFETAKAIAKTAGIYTDGDTILTGDDLVHMSNIELLEALPKVSVFARVTSEHKFKIIELYKSQGQIIGMTGDGVNDALSLAAADLGIAMGKTGTEVAKESSDIVLLDDNFGSIVSAIEEGRHIYHSIKKVITYLASTSIAGMLIILTALLLGYPIPLHPSQIIWLNFITDGFLTVALAMEKNSLSIETTSNYSRGRSLLSRKMIVRIAINAAVMTAGTLVLFLFYVSDFAKASTISLTAMAMFQWFNALNCRSENHSIFRIPFFSNMYLIYSAFVVIILQFLAIYWQPLQIVLKTVPLSSKDWVLIFVTCISIIISDEIRKLVYSKKV